MSNAQGICLTFIDKKMNNCLLTKTNETGYKQCFRCYINTIIPSPDQIILDKNCSPIINNHCVDLYFNTTILFENFSNQYSYLINKLFDKDNRTNRETHNNLYIHIEYDTLDILSLDTIHALVELKNRSFFSLALELKNRDDQLTLKLDNNLQNISLTSLQINIYCGLKGLYQYDYIPSSNQYPLLESLRCEIPITTTTTNNNRYKIIIFSLIGGGSLIPCFILACCLYILCQQNIKQTNYYHEEEEEDSSTDTSVS